MRSHAAPSPSCTTASPTHTRAVWLLLQMLKFVTRTPPTDAKDTIKWVQIVKRPGTTALIDTPCEKKSGSYVTHSVHKKVMLINAPSPGKLTVKLLSTNEQVVVDAADCGPPFSAPLKVTSDYNDLGRMANLCHACGCANPLLPWTMLMFGRAGAKPGAKAAGKQPAQVSEEQAAPPKKKGRPVGSKDKQARQPKTIKIAWHYGGKKGPGGMQFGAIGQACTHDRFGEGFIVQQPIANSLMLQFGAGDDATLSTVDSRDVQGIAAAAVVEEPAGSSSGTASTKRRPGATRKRSAAPAPVSVIQKRSTKAQVVEAKKRKKREATAARKGKPLKPAREQKNKRWGPDLKKQAVDIYNTKYAATKNFEGCRKELLRLPGFDGVTRGNVQGWVVAADKLAAQEPNEFGLVIYQQGRPPTLPEPLYNELKEQLKGLAKTKAFTLNATSMRPIVLAFIISKIGVEAIRPGVGRFSASAWWISKLARDACLRWRKPFGDSRKHPPDADARIQDMLLRLAYLMHEHGVPPALVVNFDHTGLHFMQMRGNTWTVVEEDTGTAHNSRPAKEKEVKQQNKGDKRQATGTVGTSMAGDGPA